MPDFGAPVAAGVNIDPMKGVKTLSDLLGIQQQKQALQTGAIEQQSKALGLQTAQTLQPSTIQAGQAAAANAATGARQSAFTLTKDQAHTAFDAATPLSISPDILKAAQDEASGADPDTLNSNYKTTVRLIQQARQRAIDSGVPEPIAETMFSRFMTQADHPQQLLGDLRNVAQMRGGPATASGVLNTPMGTTNTGTANVVTPPMVPGAPGAPRPGQIVAPAGQAPAISSYTDRSGNLQPYQTNPQFPGGMGPTGPAVAQGIPPQVVTPPGGVPGIAAGRNVPTNTGAGAGPAPTDQDWHDFGAYSANLNARVRTASDVIPRVQQAEAAMDKIRTGGGAPAYSNFAKILQSAGLPQSLVDKVGNGDLAASQEAEKYLFQTTFAGLKQSMGGDPARVSEFQSAEQVFPTVGTDPRATKNVLNFMVDQGKRDYAEQQALVQARRSNAFNPVTWQADYQQRLRANQVPGTPGSQVPGGTQPAGEQRTTSKSGKPIVFRNGRWEYE